MCRPTLCAGCFFMIIAVLVAVVAILLKLGATEIYGELLELRKLHEGGRFNLNENVFEWEKLKDWQDELMSKFIEMRNTYDRDLTILRNKNLNFAKDLARLEAKIKSREEIKDKDVNKVVIEAEKTKDARDKE